VSGIENSIFDSPKKRSKPCKINPSCQFTPALKIEFSIPDTIWQLLGSTGLRGAAGQPRGVDLREVAEYINGLGSAQTFVLGRLVGQGKKAA
jgi:hypothetical protein